VRVMVTGASGQDGQILTRRLVADGHSVLAVTGPGCDGPGGSGNLFWDIPQVHTVPCDLRNLPLFKDLLTSQVPERIFHLAGISSIAEAERNPAQAWSVNVAPVECILDLMALHPALRDCRLIIASSGAIFESSSDFPQDEHTPMSPTSQYARSKAAATNLVQEARAKRGIFGASAIMYNHESPLRSPRFVTRKVSMGVAEVHAGIRTTIPLGSLNVARDWGWAPDYVTAMLKMAELESPSDFVLGTGRSSLLREFVGAAFAEIGVSEWTRFIDFGGSDRRPANPSSLRASSRLAAELLSWQPTKELSEIAAEMVQFDVRLLADPTLRWTEGQSTSQ